MAIDKQFFPKVSIVIPVYNGSNYLAEAIDSALAQTYSNLEIIVVNDGSCDEGQTEKIALSYGDRIRYLKKENGGVSSALNYGIREMTGEYFSWLSHDDKYEPGKVANSVAYLSGFENRDRCVALCGACHINSASEKIRNVDYRFRKDVVYPGIEVVEHILRYGVINGCCMLIPKKAFVECGGFHEDLRYNQDALMWYQIFGAGFDMVADIEQRDVMYRLHANQTSKTRRDLLLRDSRVLCEIIAPEFAKKNAKDRKLVRLLAVKNGMQNCMDAVKVCIRVGKQTGTLTGADVFCIYSGVAAGKVRSGLKWVYHRLFFKK